MSLPDRLIERYFRLATDATPAECDEVARALADTSVNPMTWKKALAHRLVRMYHGAAAADHARDQFEQQFSRREVPSEMPVLRAKPGKFRARDLMMRAFPKQYTGSAAGALFKQGAVYVNGERLEDPAGELVLGVGESSALVFKVGRKYAKVVGDPLSADP
jgi:tyrosyl-tRNA synthetase